jgi:transposase
MEYGAIDLHTKHSQICIVNAAGEPVLERRVLTRPEALVGALLGRAPVRLLVEAGTESAWVADLLRDAGHEVVVVDPNFTAMYATRARGRKTDRRDAAALAEANRLGVYRAVHQVSSAQRQVRRQLQVRDHLIHLRTQTINVVRAQVRSLGYRVPSGSAESFSTRARQLPLPAAVAALLEPLLTLLDQLGAPVRACDRAARLAATADPICARLQTAPGVGPITALQFRATLDTIERFPTAGAVAAYLGLVPREASSGERRRLGGITKAGPPRLRSVLVQASWVIWRQRKPQSAALPDWVHRLAARRGRPIAIVALARRLARILFAMWRDGRAFDARGGRTLSGA